ncbi:MAG TPA: fatty acid CoA ligase family protein [Sandaracinaceae bacterium LLY-WYZ-13_1]|nr:fatty acid CoA ligase family protein [Sandaracinaceae bacterium LLY-WYZ-13_1]
MPKEPAAVDAPPPEVSADRPSNVAAHLPRQAARQPFAPAIFFPDGRGRRGRVRYTHYTYRQLDEASDRIARGLRAHGVTPGTRVALMVRPSLELFSLVFGLFKGGAVPVMIDPGIGLKNMKACLAKARPEVFIGVPAAQAARLVLRWAPGLRTVITVGRKGPWRGPTLDDVERDGARGGGALVATEPDDLAAILFTSGSTGPPKGAVYTHRNFATQVDAIRRMYGIEPGEVDLPTFPLFALFDPALGMTTVIPDMDPTRPAKADPAKIVEAIEDFGVTNMFGSPALLNALGRWGEARGKTLPSLRRVISAGAPVPAHVLRRMRAMLPDEGRVVTPYGATECLPVATIESREVLEETAARTAEGAGVCVGHPVPEAEVHVVRITDAPIRRWSDAETLPAGAIGEIVVKGAQATRRYFDAEPQTALAKIPDDEGPGFRHRMGDLGYLDEDGRLWFCGRKSQRVEADGRTFFTVPCEGVFDAHPDVFRSALVKVSREGRAEPVICVELEPHAKQRDRAALRRELRERAEAFEHTAPIARFLVHPGFPVDVRHNAKIRREALARWAAEARR